MKKELLERYLNNKVSAQELHEVLRWIRDDEFRNERMRMISEDWNTYQESARPEEEATFTAIFDKIQEKIGPDQPKANHPEGKTIQLSWAVTWLTRVAAILLLPVLTILFYTLSEKKNLTEKYTHFVADTLEVIAPMGSRTVVQLSDGSEVHLNYGSRIRYPQFFSGETRRVSLTGEGFFKVAHNPEKPFVVKAGSLNIKAVGTVFNVMAYPGDDVIETTLVNGKVILEQVGTNGSIKPIGTMWPGQHVGYHLRGGDISTTEGKVEKYISWTNGKLIFEDTPIQQVAERLSRMFNVDFQVKADVRDYTYTVTLEDESLSQILDLITIATPVVCKSLPRKRMADGAFSKQVIVLERRK